LNIVLFFSQETQKIKPVPLLYRLPALSEKIVELAQDHGRINIKFISTTLEANRNTVKKHVQQLVRMGQLVRLGKGRGTYYSPY
jgi:Fic family protein